uniref:Uncharacterized protein n=1 Tax=Neolamprologus brichardi TaxID=32507 RepID=A0A3Q4HM80_NEOBR
MSAESGDHTVLVLLDLTSAFDTVNHTILISRLRDLVGMSGSVLDWFSSYISERSFSVSANHANHVGIYRVIVILSFFSNIKQWLNNNCLQLNLAKTETLIIAPDSRDLWMIISLNMCHICSQVSHSLYKQYFIASKQILGKRV